VSKIRTLIKQITKPFFKTGLQCYFRKPRKYTYKEVEVLVHPEVFPPHVTLSTKILLDFIDTLHLKNKTFLELGCGSGIISLYAVKKGAKATATDINKTALAYLKNASENNQLPLEIVFSDLFNNIKKNDFNYIIINPPYYPKNPKNIKEQAWFCGDDFQYFKNLFLQLPSFLTTQNNTYMILSEDCDISKIKELAASQKIKLQQISKTKKMGEINFIFKLSK
jgi:release factor glutamine methyltransferase